MATDRQRVKLGPFLEPGETVKVVVSAESGLSRLLVFVSTWSTFFSKEWLIVRTDRRILVFRARATLPRRLEAEYRVEEAIIRVSRSGLWWRLDLGDAHYRVSGSFGQELEVLSGQREPEREKAMNLECSTCGFLNYEDATQCAKCHATLQSA